MRRLTLILSDLYLPADSAAGGFPHTHTLPSLDWLLRFADVERIGDWRRWQRRTVDGHISGLPVAVIAGNLDTPPLTRLDNVWLATPVRLEARLDHVRLVDRGLLRVRDGERAAWCEEFNRIFGPQYLLRECGERAFQLVGLEPVDMPIVDPARLLGAEIGPSLPGPQAGELRRLWTEIEMWLHGSPLNLAREQSRQPRISAFWIWGNEPVGPTRPSVDPADFHWYGGDPLIRGLILRSGNRRVATQLSEVDLAFDHVFAEFAPLTGGAEESLPVLEQNWFAPARAAVERGSLEYLQVVANDRVFSVRPRAGWKFWRRRRNWLESLA